MGVLAHAPSKYVLTELTLRSMIELERVKAGIDFETDVLYQLSDALLGTSNADSSAAPFRFVEPGYFEPYERLVRHADSVQAPAIGIILAYIKQVSDDLRMVASGDPSPVNTLIPVCVALHQELINEINSEDTFVGNDWSSVGESAPAVVSEA